MSTWTVDVVSPTMAARLADPQYGPLRAYGFGGQITQLDGGMLRLDHMAVMSLCVIDWRDDGHVTWEEGGPVLHIGQDTHPLMPATDRVF